MAIGITVLSGNGNLVQISTGNDTINIGGQPTDTGPGALNIGLDSAPPSIDLHTLGLGVTIAGSPTVPSAGMLGALKPGSGAVANFLGGHSVAPTAAALPTVHSSYLTLADGSHVELKNFVPTGKH